MKVLSNNAATLMFAKVQSLGAKHESWRCIHLALSQVQERNHYALRSHFVVNAVTEMMADMDGYIYLCEDGDIFILFQGAMRPVLQKLSTRFDGISPERVWEQPEDRLFTIFDLSRYWQEFYDLCRVKSQRERGHYRNAHGAYMFTTPADNMALAGAREQ